MPSLVARAKVLGPAFDLLANYRPGGFFFERAGMGVSTVGIAERIGVEGGPERLATLAREVETVLREVHRDGDEPSPIAVGAIPFDSGWPAHLIVPERSVIRRREGETRQLDVVPEGLAPLNPPRGRAARPRPPPPPGRARAGGAARGGWPRPGSSTSSPRVSRP